MVIPAATDASVSYLARLLSALEFTETTLRGTEFLQDDFRCNDRGASVRLTTPDGNAYRVTVESLSEESP